MSERVTCVLAPNAGPMTLDGTNTWIIGEPNGDCLVIDPGPQDEGHLSAIREAARQRHSAIVAILLTHGHPDHSEGAARFGEWVGAPVRALDPAHTLGAEGLQDGDVVMAGSLEVHVVGTPGHTSDCLSFLLPAEQALLTGDTVLGRGSTVVAWPDGHLGDYLASLADLRERATSTGARTILPGHGPVLADPAQVITAYLDHRHQRLEQVRRAWSEGARTPEAVVEVVYDDIPAEVVPAALLSVRAQLEYLNAI